MAALTVGGAITAMGFGNPGQFAQWFGELESDEQALVTTGITEWLDCER